MVTIADIGFSSSVAGDLHLPDGIAPKEGFPAAVLIHGGGWTSMDRSRFNGIADMLAEHGFAVFNIDYRLAPQHPWPAGLNDCKAAIKYLQYSDFPVNKKKIFVIGGSAGGHYALVAGLSMPKNTVCGIISISGIDDVFAHSFWAECLKRMIFCSLILRSIILLMRRRYCVPTAVMILLYHLQYVQLLKSRC